MQTLALQADAVFSAPLSEPVVRLLLAGALGLYLGLERDVVESHDVFVPKEFKEAVTQFNKGQMVVKQPDVRAVEIKGLPACLTHHSN